MPGPLPTPTSIKRARGTLRAGAARREPQPPTGLICPPTHVLGRAEALGAWRRVAPLAEAMGTLTPADVEAFALACVAYADMSEARAIVAREGSTQTKVTDRGGTSVVSHPAVAQAADAWRRYLAALAHFGLTPASRARLTIAPSEEVDPFAEFDRAAA